ncbi:LPXTG cell wall anchor domain-containing protein [Streptomyces cyaneofuscatus]|uniref:LPXTG cell wall anchor domain-containing protein n=1 Tax=Streptomyces cyaneofuscatus TaxID=66883 RepID=UPI003422E66C
MGIAASGRRTLLSATAVSATAALIALGAAPAQADAIKPDLGVRALAPVTGIAAGSGFGLPVSLLNKGTEELPKVWVSYTYSSGIAPAETYSNCVYYTLSPGGEWPEEHRADCTVDQPLKPGVLYGTEQPIALTARANALYDEVGLGLLAEEPVPHHGEPEPGTGGPLKLVERGEATAADRAAHAEPGSRTEVTAVNTADYALTGAELQGKVGDKVTALVTFTNEGPARVYRDQGTSAANVDVHIPAGTTATKAHGFCRPVTQTHYRCGTSQSWVEAKGGETYSFVLRIDKAVGRTTGRMSFGGAARPFDKNAANDTAEIVVDTPEPPTDGTESTGGTSSTGGSAGPTGSTDGGTGSTGGSTSGSSGSASSGSTGGSDTGTTGGSATSGSGSTSGGTTPQTGGGLAATGSDSTLPLAGAAGAALLAGGSIVWAVRRRSAARAS